MALRKVGRSLPDLHGRDGQRLVRQIAEGWNNLGDAASVKLCSVLSEAQFALGRELVRRAKEVLMDRDHGRER
jgi:hypothetical protein